MVKEIDSSYIIENWNTNIRVYAGPGAGKTYFLIQNIKNLIDKNPKLRKFALKKILCITYTNIAADEIKRRLSEYADYVQASTIHKFIGDFIIKPYQKQLKEIIKEEFDIEISEKITITPQVEGLGILYGHEKEEVYEFLKEKLNEDISFEYSTQTIGKIQVDINDIDENDFAKLANVKHEKTEISETHKKLIKKFLWSRIGRLTHDELLYFGYKLIKKYKIIPYMLRINFPFILIDEFQDTSPLQTKLIQMMAQDETLIGIVGDTAQSIYSFQGAKPEFFRGFKIENKNINDYQIPNNRRSTDEIVNFCNYLRQNDALKQKAVENKNSNIVNIVIDSDVVNNASRIDEFISETNSVVLTRSWVDAIRYAQGISKAQKDELIRLYNAYYNYPGDFRQDIIEYNNINWVKALIFIKTLNKAVITDSVNEIVSGLKLYIDTKEAFNNSKKLKILLDFFKFSKDFFADIKEENIDLITLFEKFNCDFGSYEYAKFIFSFRKNEDGAKQLLQYPSKDSEKDYEKKLHNLLAKITFQTGKKLVDEIFSKDSKYITAYQAKGAEYESVFVALRASRFDKNIKEQQVDIKNVLLNPNTIDEEFDRLLYVACSRAINKLYVYLEGDSKYEKTLQNAIDKWKQDNDIKRDFYKVTTI